MTEQKTADILIVDDVPDNLRLLYSMLDDFRYAVRGVRSSKMVFSVIATSPPDSILLDGQ